MNRKAIAIYSLFFILLFSIIIAACVTILRMWWSTNRCLSLQSTCERTRFLYCALWLDQGAEQTDKWPQDAKTCKVENKEEITCPKPLNEDECKLAVYGSTGTTTTI
jgi:hypothetical protein